MRTTAKTAAFNGGVLSLWSPTPFRGPEAYAELLPRLRDAGVAVPQDGNEITSRYRGRTYSCGQQHHCASRAWLAGDLVAIQQIQASLDPKEMMAIARTTRLPAGDAWGRAELPVLVAGAIARLSSMERLADELLSTGDRQIVLGSQYDRHLGVGIDWREPAVHDQTAWRGTNIYGKALTEARNVIARRRGTWP